jgi:hypothetical protein
MLNLRNNLSRIITNSGQGKCLANPIKMLQPKHYRPVVATLLANPSTIIPHHGSHPFVNQGLFTGLEECLRYEHGQKLRDSAESFLRFHFANFFFDAPGRSVIEFAQYLVAEFLTKPEANAGLVFHLMGASTLEMTTRILAPIKAQGNIHGLYLNTNILGSTMSPKTQNQPLIMRYLWQEGVLNHEKVVFIDSSANATLPRLTCDLLNNSSLINYTNDVLRIILPRESWETKILMYFLAKDPSTLKEYDITGYNLLRPDLNREQMHETATIIDHCHLERPAKPKALVVKEEQMTIDVLPQNNYTYQIMEEELLEVAAAIG